jgi:AcrR family transcriptional regulator
VAARPALTRGSILAAARELLVAEGLAAVSLRRLAARLGVTAPALYAHVDSKDDLIGALAEDEFARLIDHIELRTGTAPGADDDPVDRIRVQSRAYVEYALANPTLFQVMFVFRPDTVPQPDAPELPLASKAFAMAAVAVEDAIARRLLRETDSLLASLTIWSAVHGVATVLLASPGFAPDDERALIDSVIDSVVAGLAAPHSPRSRDIRRN